MHVPGLTRSRHCPFPVRPRVETRQGLRQPSFLLISSTQETMTEPKVRVNLNGATELLNRRIPASCKHQSPSDAEGRESGEWIGLLCPLGFRDSLIVSPHRRQEPTVVRVSVRIVGTQFNGSFEFLFRCGPIPVIPVRDDRHGNVSPASDSSMASARLAASLVLGPASFGDINQSSWFT